MVYEGQLLCRRRTEGGIASSVNPDTSSTGLILKFLGCQERGRLSTRVATSQDCCYRDEAMAISRPFIVGMWCDKKDCPHGVKV